MNKLALIAITGAAAATLSGCVIVSADVREHWDHNGDFGTLYYACHDWLDPTLGKRSMQLMAEEVMPKVNAALGKAPA